MEHCLYDPCRRCRVPDELRSLCQGDVVFRRPGFCKMAPYHWQFESERQARDYTTDVFTERLHKKARQTKIHKQYGSL